MLLGLSMSTNSGRNGGYNVIEFNPWFFVFFMRLVPSYIPITSFSWVSMAAGYLRRRGCRQGDPNIGFPKWLIRKFSRLRA
jgi:hypothetical protein